MNRNITFPVIKGTGVRRNAETGVEIRNDGPDGWAVRTFHADRGDLMTWHGSLAEARAAAIVEVEAMRELIAEDYAEAMSVAPTADPVVIVTERIPGLVKLAVAGLPDTRVDIVKANGSWYAGINHVTIGGGHRTLSDAMLNLISHLAYRIRTGLMPRLAAPAEADAHLPVAGVAGTSLGEMREAFRPERVTPKRTQHYSHALTPLVVGEAVRGISFGVTPAGRLSYLTQWGGVYEGERASEWDGTPVHFYASGFIGDVPQVCFAHPVAQYA